MRTVEAIAEQIRTSRKCRLCKGCTNPVPGVGSSKAQIMFVGEAPGENEDKQGLPFVGAAGKFLDELLASVNLRREDVFITNVVKCRPPANRDPLPEEVADCWPYLKEQIAVIKPKVIVLLGRHAMNRFLPNLKISDVHGKPKRYKGQVYLPLYHPAAALYKGDLRKVLYQDFQCVPAVLKTIDRLPQTIPEFDEPVSTSVVDIEVPRPAPQSKLF